MLSCILERTAGLDVIEIKTDMTFEECVEKIKQSTRRYAKRQLTWFRRRDDILRVYTSESETRKIFYKNVLETIAKSEIL